LATTRIDRILALHCAYGLARFRYISSDDQEPWPVTSGYLEDLRSDIRIYAGTCHWGKIDFFIDARIKLGDFSCSTQTGRSNQAINSWP